jgi:hypothetical protein
MCFGRHDGGVIIVQNRQGSEIYSFQALAPMLIAEPPLPMPPGVDRTPPPVAVPDEIQSKPARNFWNLATPPPAVIPDETPPPAAWTGAPAEAEGVEPLWTAASDSTVPRAAAAMGAGPLTMFYAEAPFAGRERKRRSRRVARWSVRIIGLLALLVLAYLIWARI